MPVISIRRSLIAFLLTCGCLQSARALDPNNAITQFVKDVWTAKEGLPQHSVNAIIRTQDGYLWLTQEELVRFDGMRFTIFDRKNRSFANEERLNEVMQLAAIEHALSQPAEERI